MIYGSNHIVIVLKAMLIDISADVPSVDNLTPEEFAWLTNAIHTLEIFVNAIQKFVNSEGTVLL